MKNLKKIICGLIIVLMAVVGITNYSKAQIGGGIAGPILWILDSGVVKTASNAWSVEMGDVNITGNITGVLELANNTWMRAIDNAGTGVVNMFKVNTSDNIEVGATLDLNTNIATNIGNAGTDFTASGGLTLADDLTITGDDLIMNTNTSGGLLVADGTNFNPVVMGGNATIGTTGTVEVNDVTCTNCLNATEIEDIYVLNSGDQMTGELTMTNNTWFRARNNADSDYINMFKVTTSDEIEIGGTFLTGNIEFDTDSGVATIVDMPVSATPVAGTEMSYTFKIDGTNIMTIYSEADSSGDIQNEGVSLLTLKQEDVGATCTVGNIRFDTGGATDELCYCSATDTWKCVALGALAD